MRVSPTIFPAWSMRERRRENRPIFGGSDPISKLRWGLEPGFGPLHWCVFLFKRPFKDKHLRAPNKNTPRTALEETKASSTKIDRIKRMCVAKDPHSRPKRAWFRTPADQEHKLKVASKKNTHTPPSPHSDPDRTTKNYEVIVAIKPLPAYHAGPALVCKAPANYMALGQNQWFHFGDFGAPPILGPTLVVGLGWF